MNEREQLGLAIAARCKLNRNERAWIVPGQRAGDAPDPHSSTRLPEKVDDSDVGGEATDVDQ